MACQACHASSPKAYPHLHPQQRQLAEVAPLADHHLAAAAHLAEAPAEVEEAADQPPLLAAAQPAAQLVDQALRKR